MTNYFGVSDELLTDDGFLLLGSKPQVEYAVGLIKIFNKNKDNIERHNVNPTQLKILQLCIEDITRGISNIASADMIVKLLLNFSKNPSVLFFKKILDVEILFESLEKQASLYNLDKSSFMENRFYLDSLKKFCETQNKSPNYGKTKGKVSPLKTIETKLTPKQLHESYCQWMLENSKTPPLTYDACKKIKDSYVHKGFGAANLIEEEKKKDPYVTEFYAKKKEQNKSSQKIHSLENLFTKNS